MNRPPQSAPLPDSGPTEPDLEDPNAQTAPAAAAEEVPEDPPKPEEKPIEYAYESDPRKDIYARRSESLKKQETADEGVFETGDEDTDQDRETDGAQPIVAEGRKSVKIKVYGEEREVPESEVIRAGIATLQKDAAADVRLAQAARREAELKAEEQRLLALSENLRKGLDVNGLPLATADQPPAKGVAGSRTISKEAQEKLAEEAVQALYSGDAGEAKAKLLNFISEAKSAPSQFSPQIVKTVEEAVLASISARQQAESDERDRQEANRIFREDYRDIADNPDSFAMAKGLLGRLAQDPEWQGKSRAEVAREVGERIRKLTGGASRDPLAAQRDRKRTLQNPSAAAGRQPAPTPTRFPSNSEYIQQLRRNSGSNTV